MIHRKFCRRDCDLSFIWMTAPHTHTSLVVILLSLHGTPSYVFQLPVVSTLVSHEEEKHAVSSQSINQSIRALMQVDKPQRDRVNEYITVPC